MRFTSLEIKNFKAVELFRIEDLADFIVIAGPNGAGKTCVLDAVRLLKSVYGGYQEDEVMQWFGEFQMTLKKPASLSRLFRDPSLPVGIRAGFQLAEEEVAYLQENVEEVLEPLIWARVTGRNLSEFNYSSVPLAAQFRQHRERVDREIANEAAKIRAELEVNAFELAVEIGVDFRIEPAPCPTMELVFQTYDPTHLGIVEYHSASRNYQREQVGGINLDVTNLEQQRRQQSLYNWQSKYSNVKTELATTYLRELVAADAGVESSVNDLNETLAELFQTFFPDKEYLGVQPEPSGTLTFPVRLANEQEHDINELSSGEKEVVYGYLRLRNSTPRHSTILLDEPELHLNPALLQGFPDFYYRNLGVALGNQLWLVTHSDTLLRQAVGNHNYSVFHMKPGSNGTGANQALQVVADDELERATIDLVGDLATYRPQSKVVLFEGGGDTEVDRWMTTRLFPELTKGLTLVSGGGKRRVRDLYEVLAETAEGVGVANRFFAVTDKDTAPSNAPLEGARVFQWDSYHIENYLLEPEHIHQAMAAVMQAPTIPSVDEVGEALHVAAGEIRSSLLVERLQKRVNDALVGAIRIGGPPGGDPLSGLMPSIESSIARLDELRPKVLDASALQAWADEIEEKLASWLETDEWMKEFPGRQILRGFVSSHLRGTVDYEAFRNVIVDKMVEAGFEPPGMSAVLTQILET